MRYKERLKKRTKERIKEVAVKNALQQNGNKKAIKNKEARSMYVIKTQMVKWPLANFIVFFSSTFAKADT
jgi:hypothetical protein